MERKKALVYTLVYLLLLLALRFVKVREVMVADLLILVGGVLGIRALDRESRLMSFLGHSADKPVLRNVLCQVTLVALAFYVATSTVSLFSMGLVLGILVRTLIEQYLGLQGVGDLSSWFWFFGGRLALRFQKGYLAILGLLTFWVSWIST